MTVSPTTVRPDYHLQLTDGTTTVKLNAIGANGIPNEQAISITQLERTAIKTSSGDSNYSDLELPYMTITQQDWSGGRGSKNLEDDKSRYYDGYRVNTWEDGKLKLGPMEYFGTGYRTEERYDFEDLVDTAWDASTIDLTAGGTNVYWSTKFTTTSAIAVDEIWIYVKYVESGTINIAIYSDNGSGKPLTNLVGDPPAILMSSDNIGEFMWVRCKLDAESLTTATDYHLVVWSAGRHILAGRSGSGNRSANGSTWTTSTVGFFFRLLETADNKGIWKLLEHKYKGALYAYTQPVTGNSLLYINGDRGVADSNTGVLTTLVDAAKSWTVNEWANCVVKITAGPGSEEEQNWRTISSNTATALTVSPAWNVTHTTSTEYVIIGSNKWTNVEDLGGFVTDYAVTDDWIYFARGETASANLLRYRWYNNAGTATDGNDAENIDGRYLLSIWHPDDDYNTLYIAQNDNAQFGTAVGKMMVPGTWEDLMYRMGTLAPCNVPWADVSISNCTQTTDDQATKIAITDTFTTGMIATKNLDSPVDITRANYLGFWIKSTETFSASELYFCYDEFTDTGDDANYLMKRKNSTGFFHLAYSSGEPTYVVFSNCIDGNTSTYSTLEEAHSTGAGDQDVDIQWDSADAIIVMNDYKFNTITFDLGTKNAVAATLTAKYYDGSTWSALTITDGTVTTAATVLNGTFATSANWTFGTDGGGGWAHDAGNQEADCSGAQTGAVDLTQASLLTVGKTYIVTFTVKNYSAGTVTLYAGTTAGTARSTNDTFIETITCAGTTSLIFKADADFIGSIDTVSIAAATTMAIDGSITFTPPSDWQPYQILPGKSEHGYILENVDYSGYAVMLISSADLTNGMTILNNYVSASNQVRLDIGALTANEWVYKTLSITPEKFPAPDDTQVQSVGLYIGTDQNATFNIMLRGTVDLLYDEPEWRPLPANAKITNMVAYSGNLQEPRTNPWIFTDSTPPFELQTQNGDIFVPMPIGELGEISSENNGRVACVNGPYLYFSYGENKLERFYNNSLDDVGPDLEEGLPFGREGRIGALLSYPSGVFASVTDRDDDNIASILYRKGNGWHEIFRSPLSVDYTSGNEINSFAFVSIPGDTVGDLWFSQGNDLLKVKFISGNSRTSISNSYRFTPFGFLETGWIYGNMIDIYKLWRSVKLFMEEADSEQYIEADYRADNSTTWTAITGNFNTEPSEELSIATTYPNKKRIKFRLKLHSLTLNDSPEINAMLVECYGVVPVKNQFVIPTIIKDRYLTVDLTGKPQKAGAYTNLADTALTKLEAWRDAGTPLTLTSTVRHISSKTVVIPAIEYRPYHILKDPNLEQYYVSVALHEI